MTNWRTNLGGALEVLGTSLVGIGVVPQLGGTSSKFLTMCAVSGFIIGCAGKFFSALFAADAKVVAVAQQQIGELQARSNMVPNAIESGDTSILRKADITPVAPPPVAPNPPKP